MGDYPYVGPVAHDSGDGNLPVNRIVIHCTVGADGKGAAGTAAYFRDPNSRGSAHSIVDSDETLICAHDQVVCWHAPPNSHSYGIELCCSLSDQGKGHWTLASHIAMLKRAAVLTAEKCLQHKIPVVKINDQDLREGKRGICGHIDVSLAFKQSTHWDPGPYFPWAQFMEYVRAAYAALTQEEELPMAIADDILSIVTATAAEVRTLKAAEAGRYADYVRRFNSILGAVSAASDSDSAEVRALVAQVATSVTEGFAAADAEDDAEGVLEGARWAQTQDTANAILAKVSVVPPKA